MRPIKPKVPSPDILQNLPRDLRLMTDEQWEAWVRWEAEAFTYGQLRRRQALIHAQQKLGGGVDADMVKCGLVIRYDILSAAIGLREFGDDGLGDSGQWQAHKGMFQRLRLEQPA